MTLAFIVLGLSIFGFGMVAGLTVAVWSMRAGRERMERRQRALDKFFNQR